MAAESPRPYHYTYNANNPNEDAVLAAGDLFVVMDGHGGSETCAWLLETFHSEFREQSKSKRDTTDMLKDLFKSLDTKLIAEIIAEKDRQLQKKRIDQGACVIAAVVDREAGKLFVANAGDCKCVAGVRNRITGEVTPVSLSILHNINDPAERKRLKGIHPSDKTLWAQLKDGPDAGTYYLKGIVQVTRSIGDVYLKDTTLSGIHNKNTPHLKVLPLPSVEKPYITCDPEIRELPLASAEEDISFVILASDGIWDHLNDAEAVQIVADCFTRKGKLTPEQAPEKLAEEVMRKVAVGSNMTEAELRALQPGRGGRRGVHDDMTAMVIPMQSYVDAVSTSNRIPLVTAKSNATERTISAQSSKGSRGLKRGISSVLSNADVEADTTIPPPAKRVASDATDQTNPSPPDAADTADSMEVVPPVRKRAVKKGARAESAPTPVVATPAAKPPPAPRGRAKKASAAAAPPTPAAAKEDEEESNPPMRRRSSRTRSKW